MKLIHILNQMRDCHLKHRSDRVVPTCGHMTRLIPPGSLYHILTLVKEQIGGGGWVEKFSMNILNPY